MKILSISSCLVRNEIEQEARLYNFRHLVTTSSSFFTSKRFKPASGSAVERMLCLQSCEWSTEGFSSESDEVHRRSSEGGSDWDLRDMLPREFRPKPVVRWGKRERAYNRHYCAKGVQEDVWPDSRR